MSGLVVEHIVSRTVRDSAAMLDVTAGPAPGDPYYAPPGPKSWLAASRKKTGKLRIGFAATKPDGNSYDAECLAAVGHAVNLCKDLGHKVEPASPAVDMEQIVGCFMTLWTGGLAMQVDMLTAQTGKRPSTRTLEGLTLGLYEAGKQVTASQYLAAVAAVQALSRQVAAWHDRYDVWMTPTLGKLPMPLGSFDTGERNPLKGFAPMIDYAPFTAIQNATGQPAISLPLYIGEAGLPVGVQFIGPVGGEPLLLQLATALEKADPWGKRHPAVWG
jgi:amidase